MVAARQSALENNVAEVASVLSHSLVFLLLGGAQVRNKSDVQTLVTVEAQTQDKPDLQRSVLENNANELSWECRQHVGDTIFPQFYIIFQK